MGSAAASPSKQAAKRPAAAKKISIQQPQFFTRSDLAFVFHLVCLLTYTRVWLWHTTPPAQLLPGAHGFGWFFRYLTFYSYTLQLLQLFLCCLAHLTKEPARKRALSGLADRLSCAVFGLANTVTAMFYAIESSTAGLVEGGGLQRPQWLQLAVHLGNSMVAWADLLLVEERTFCGRSRHLATSLGLAYGAWILLVRGMYGKFPYPIMNKLPAPAGYVGFFAVGMVVVLAAFELGALVKLGGRGRGRRPKTD